LRGEQPVTDPTTAWEPWPVRFGIDKDVLIGVLLVLEVLTLVALGVVTWSWHRERTLARRLTAEASQGHWSGRPSARQAANWAVKTMLDAPGRVRERGFVGGMLMAPIEELTGIALQDREEIVAVAAEDGTVTIMFSDIEDSTSLNERLGDDAWVKVLSAHERMVRSAVAHCEGHVVKSQGDGFMLVFGSPEHAMTAAARMQRKLGSGGRHLRRTPVKVRIGIHCGTAVLRDGDYFGRNVAKAARVTALADGGETLVTDEVRERLGEDAGLERYDVVQLKGLAGEHVLWRVVSDDQPSRRTA
jgi:class 3 adenylate cyclase